MGHCSTPTFLEWQSWLRTIQGLNLALFIDKEHQNLLGRVQIQANNIGELPQKFRIPRKFEAFGPMY
jgi:hypothetical protein